MKTLELLVFFLSAATTVCGDCPQPTGGGNMVLVTDVSFPAPEGTEVRFRCEMGYVRHGGRGTITCAGGQWTELNLRCERVNCGSAGEVLNGNIHYSGTSFGDFAHVECNEGYVAIGFRKMVCGAHGWMGRLPVCEVMMCEAPTIANGYFSPEKEAYEFREIVLFTCEGDFKLIGSNVATCEKDGRFQPAPPTCSRLQRSTSEESAIATLVMLGLAPVLGRLAVHQPQSLQTETEKHN